MLKNLLMVMSIPIIGCSSQKYEMNYDYSTSNLYKEVGDISDTSNPIHSPEGWSESVLFVVSDQAPAAVIEAAILSAESWNDAIGREVLICQGTAALDARANLYGSLVDTTTAIYYEREWTSTTEKPIETLGITIWEDDSSENHMIKADLILNAENYEFLNLDKQIPYELQNLRLVDAQSILVHEFGHLLGLNHVSEESDPLSVMHEKTYTANRSTQRKVSALDAEHIKAIYK